MLLEIEELEVTFPSKRGTIKAVDKISLRIEGNVVFGIAGESGSGKSTTALSILKAIKPPGEIRGKIRVNGRDVLSLNGDELRKYRWKDVSMVFQGAMNSLNPVKTVGSQISSVIMDHTATTRVNAMQKAEKLLHNVKLPPGLLKRYPHQLSGGQKQRVVIAMAMALDPLMIIADEPTTALDVISQDKILELLSNIVENNGITVLLISHDLSILSRLCDYIAIMYLGSIVEIGRAEDVFKSPGHPYTKLLIESNVTIDDRGGVIKSIGGYPSAPIDLPRNCKFSNRCPYASTECYESEPPEVMLEADRKVYCYHPRSGNGK